MMNIKQRLSRAAVPLGLIGAVIALPVTAQEDGNPASENTSSGESKSSTAESVQSSSSALNKIIGTEILDGIMKVDKRVSRTRVGLTVDLLAAPDLVNWPPKQVATLKLSNDRLGDMDSIARAISAVRNSEEREILTEAFAYLQDENRAYSRYWKPDPVTTRLSSGLSLANFLNDGTILASEYFSLLLERNIVNNLFLSDEKQKLVYDLRLAPASYVPTPFDDELFTINSDNVEWEIKVFRSIEVPEPEQVAYYRFAVRAVAEPHEFVIPNSYWLSTTAGAQPEIRASAYLKKDGGQLIELGLNKLMLPQNTDVKAFEPVVKDLQETLNIATGKDAVPNQLRHVLSFVGGKGALSGLVSRALTQSPIQNNSIVTGGLLDFSGDTGPEPLVGVNQGFASFGSVDAGVLLGASPESDTSIFIGPSLRSSLVTLGVGARISGKDSLEVGTAGVLSIDLSRVLEDEATGPKRIAIENPRAGGTLGELVNKVAQDQMILLVSMETPPALRKTAWVDFTRTHTDIGCKTPVASEPADPADAAALSTPSTFKVTYSPMQYFQFEPKGCYKGKVSSAILDLLDTYDFAIEGSVLEYSLSDSSEEEGTTLKEGIIYKEGTFIYPLKTDGLQNMEIHLVPK